MTIVALLGYNEFFDIKYEKKLKFIKVLGLLFLILISLNGIFYKFDISVLLLILLIVLSIFIIVYNNNELYSINDSLYVFGIVCLLGVAFNNIVCLRDTDIIKCMYIFIIAFITDTYAYIGGMLIGRHKLTEISPKKTIEGSLIGTIMGVVVGGTYCYCFMNGYGFGKALLISFVLTILSEVGDLIFSSIKRCFNKKDYSNIIPGHGGILDRFDSIIYVSLGLLLILKLF